MKILLVTRGSQGDIYPYLSLAAELKKRKHEITISLPEMFEKQAKNFGLNYVLQRFDDIGEMIDQASQTNQKTKHLLKWMRRVIDLQFEQLNPLVEEQDLLIASNTEFSATSVAEYSGKPVIRTAFAPFIPGKKIPPPVMPFPKPHKIIKPALLWKVLNKSTNFMVRKTINRNRMSRGMKPIDNFGIHSVANSHNFLMFSRYLGSTDPDWPYQWDIGGYCFNDELIYNEKSYNHLMDFIRKDVRPTIFFTLGSCNDKNRNRFCEWLLDICTQQGYKLLVGSGWSKTGSHLENRESLFLMTDPIPHSLIFPHCIAVIHHGGCGTTHSVARAGIPQLVVPLMLDQNYWGFRVSELGIGPERIKISGSKEILKKRVTELVNNPFYKENAKTLAEQIHTESGPQAFCDYIEENFFHSEVFL